MYIISVKLRVNASVTASAVKRKVYLLPTALVSKDIRNAFAKPGCALGDLLINNGGQHIQNFRCPVTVRAHDPPLPPEHR